MRLRNIPEAYLGNIFSMIENMHQTLADRAAFIGNIFFKQKTAYGISECDWSSDVCSSD
eukprot:COSAG02_NODE_48286_length_335_cov_0.360169_1_plen_58_part_10